eukprot:CAMPEP_0118927112 /NCGR_PEP_ID=MMETSP1169-20130426/4658_1 /TAXON_ID=36882 /ORGANISM="Pyramimonas obovata, Strain CCMP722" /LENGTH=505 /DNA_ID=CAMNT_0006868809 /DNA_START=34 /DNA_END=1551 /DNA_ORIENTATION=-
MTEQVDVLIVGSGPTGLGAATRLHQHKKTSWRLYDCFDEPGGLACTDLTPEGFYFDMGGHVIFSHFKYFDDLLDAAVGTGDNWNDHERVSYVRLKNRWVAYPFQNNVAALDVEDQVQCLTGLVEAKLQNTLAQSKPNTFDEWILRVMGEGIADIFMRPYNFKVWGIPTHLMQASWMGERVATVDVNRAISNVLHKKEEAGWGPNATFRFPAEGGTGAIWKKVAKLLPKENCGYGPGKRLESVDLDEQVAKFKDGTTVKYGSLLSTIPLDGFCRMVGKDEWADGLTYSNCHIIGLGIRGVNPHGLKCWLYFPEDNCPFYRATIFSHYAEKNCPTPDTELPTLCLGDGLTAPADASPKKGPYFSLMFEVCESKMKPVNQDPTKLGGTAGTWSNVVLETIKGAVATGLMGADAEIVSVYHRRIEYGYPTPSLGRDPVLAQALPWLREKKVWSRGRFGSYKYEVANQDHSLMLGVEAVDNILFGTMEATLNHPAIVNPVKNTQCLYTRE